MEYCAVTITLRAEVSLLHGFSLYVYEVVPFARPLQQCFHLILFVMQQFPISKLNFDFGQVKGSKHLCVYVSQSVEFRGKSEGFPLGQRKLSIKTKCLNKKVRI